MKVDHDELAKILGYRFHDKFLLEEALTHPSLSKTGQKKINYERLEFLGDTILALIISEILYYSSNEKEGILAKKRANLVCKKSLAMVASNLKLGQFMLMSQGEEDSGGKNNEANLENLVEALIAALYIDGGLEEARNFVKVNWEKFFNHELILNDDPKSSVQEWVQQKGKILPKYVTISQEGSAHHPIFTVELQIEGEENIRATGGSKKNAEKKAAEIFLRKYGIANKIL